MKVRLEVRTKVQTKVKIQIQVTSHVKVRVQTTVHIMPKVKVKAQVNVNAKKWQRRLRTITSVIKLMPESPLHWGARARALMLQSLTMLSVAGLRMFGIDAILSAGQSPTLLMAVQSLLLLSGDRVCAADVAAGTDDDAAALVVVTVVLHCSWRRC